MLIRSLGVDPEAWIFVMKYKGGKQPLNPFPGPLMNGFSGDLIVFICICLMKFKAKVYSWIMIDLPVHERALCDYVKAILKII